MKFNNIKLTALAVVISLTAFNCSNDDDNNSPDQMSPDFSGTYVQQDQMARPAINTVFVSTGSKDDFNMTIPTNMDAKYKAAFKSKLLELNPNYTMNALGMDADVFTGALVTDVLTVSLIGTTTFFDGVNVLTGRALADDVIDTELLLIFGGETGGDNTDFTSDGVAANDKMFSTSFPYLASPF